MGVYTVKQSKGQALYVPPGWIVVEKVVEGVLIYGIRKVLFIRGCDAVASYQAAIEVHRASGRNVSKMEQAVKYMRIDAAT